MSGDSFWKVERPNLYRGNLNPPRGCLGELLRNHCSRVIICHPTFRNEETIGRLLADGISGAAKNFPGERVAFVVSDGTMRATEQDGSTIDSALAGAASALAEAPSDDVLVALTPYEGYMEDFTPGKGSALKLVFEEMAFCDVELLILLDGDLKNDMAQWQGVFKRVTQSHAREYTDKEMFVTARYGRHFVDASLTRFVVGPLTTLMGTYVPGGISGDICLSTGAAASERGEWTEARRKYGTDISTTFDNLANPQTVIYEVYLGAKLHDITDEAKLSVMPAEVIGAALERIAHYRKLVKGVLEGDAPLKRPVSWGPEVTGIGFIDPGYTDAFDVRKKLKGICERWPEFSREVGTLVGEDVASNLETEAKRTGRLLEAGEGPLRFLNFSMDAWREALYRAVAQVLKSGDIETVGRALNYLYTAAFLEFCRMRLSDLGLQNLEDVIAIENSLGVEPSRAEAFYRDKVESEAQKLAEEFFAGRKKILQLMR